MAYDGTLKFDAELETDSFQAGANKLTDIVKKIGAFKPLVSGFKAVADAMDDAVARYDTLGQFPRLLEQMGFSAEDAGAATSRLAQGIQGLPTTLDSVVSTAQRLAVLTGNLEGATDTTLALNNAFLASGSSAADAGRGLEQYVQMLSSGKVDMQSWKTLQETMGYALNETAKAFGFAGTSAQNDLYAALQSGQITFDAFNAKIVELNGSVGGFAELAQTATGGIGTAWTNLQTGVVRGTAAIVEAVDEGLSTTRFKSIETVITVAGQAIDKVLQGVAQTAGFLVAHLDDVAAAAVGVGTAFGAYTVLTSWSTAANKAAKVSKTLEETNQKLVVTLIRGKETSLQSAAATAKETAAEAAAAAKKAATLAAEKALALEKAKAAVITGTSTEAINSQTAAEAARTASIQANKAATDAQLVALSAQVAADKAVTQAQNEQNISVGLGTALVGGLTHAFTLQQIAAAAATAGMKLLKAAASSLFFMGLAAAIGAVVAGLTKLVAFLAQGSDEYQRQKAEVEALADRQEALNQALAESADAHQEKLAAVDADAQAGKTLVGVLAKMVDENGKVTASHEDAMQAINDLNQAYDGLNLAYDEETGALSTNIKEVERYIEAKGKVSRMGVLEERRTELMRKQAEIQAQLTEAEAKRQIVTEDATMSDREKNKLIRELDAQTKGYGETQNTLALDIQANNQAIEETMDATAQTTVNSYEAMNGAVTSGGENLQQLAHKYDTTTEQILADMEAQGIGMEQWAQTKAASLTEEGLNIEQLAAKWGMTTDEVAGYMDQWGMSLDEFSNEMDATHTSAGLSLEDLADKWGISTEEIKRQMAMQGLSLQAWSDKQDSCLDDVRNGWKELPEHYEQSASELSKILSTNAERYSSWTSNIASLSGHMSAEAIAELQKLGPAANSVVEEMIVDPDKAKEFEASVAQMMASGAGGAELGAADPRWTGAGAQAGDNMGAGIASSDAVESAAQEKIAAGAQAAVAAVEEGGFEAAGRQAGQQLAGGLVSGVDETDMTGVSSGLAAAVTAGTTAVTAALEVMKAQATASLSSMSATAGESITQMMENVVSAVTSRRAAAEEAVQGMAGKIVEALKDLLEKGKKLADDTMEAIVTSIQTGTQTAKDAADQLVKDIKGAAENAIEENDFSTVGTQIIDGITKGVNDGTSGLVEAIVAAVAAAEDAARQRADIRSPSHLFRDLIGLNIMKGWAQGIALGQPLVADGVAQAVDAMERTALNAQLQAPRAPAGGLVARMQAGVTANHLRLAQAGAAGPAPAFARAPQAQAAAGPVTNYYTATIDAKNVREWNDVVKVFQRHEAVVRQGYRR